jgi:hypothetical protein
MRKRKKLDFDHNDTLTLPKKTIQKKKLTHLLKEKKIYNEYYFDYDGTLPPPKKITKKKKLTHLLDISKELSAYWKDIKEAESFLSYINKQPGKQRKIGSFSRRDNIYTDMNALCKYKDGSSFYTLLGLSQLLKIPLNPLLMQDIALKKPTGSTFASLGGEVLEDYIALAEFNLRNDKHETKLEEYFKKILEKNESILNNKNFSSYAHIQDAAIRLAQEDPDGHVILHFFEDEIGTIEDLSKIYGGSRPLLIPKNVTIKLIRSNFGSIQNIDYTIEGTGEINYNYRNTILELASQGFISATSKDYLIQEKMLAQHNKDAGKGKTQDQFQDSKIQIFSDFSKLQDHESVLKMMELTHGCEFKELLTHLKKITLSKEASLYKGVLPLEKICLILAPLLFDMEKEAILQESEQQICEAIKTLHGLCLDLKGLKGSVIKDCIESIKKSCSERNLKEDEDWGDLPSETDKSEKASDEREKAIDFSQLNKLLNDLYDLCEKTSGEKITPSTFSPSFFNSRTATTTTTTTTTIEPIELD